MAGATGSWTILLIFLFNSGLDLARGCGSVEEGSITAVRCLTSSSSDFTTFGSQVASSSSGPSRVLSVCYKNMSCVDNEPTSYQADISMVTSNTGQSMYLMLMRVGSVSREDTHLQCVIDGIVSAQCDLDVYVIPEKPVCDSPQFIDRGSIAYVKCTADKVYPEAMFNFTILPDIKDYTVKVSHQSSSRYPGDKEATCELRMPVRGLSPGDYKFRPSVHADLPDLRADHFVQGDSILVQLKEVALENHITNEIFVIEKGGDLERAIKITGNPPPNKFSLTMRPSTDSTPLNVLDTDYILTYDGGQLLLKVKYIGGSGPGFGHYTFLAGNGVGGSWPQMEYTFTIRDKDGESDSGDNDIPIIIGVVVGTAFFLVTGVLIIWLVKKQKRRNQAAHSSGTFDAPDLGDSPYIYPNFGYQPHEDGYNKTIKPPPYTVEDHTYALPNEYTEVDQPQPM